MHKSYADAARGAAQKEQAAKIQEEDENDHIIGISDDEDGDDLLSLDPDDELMAECSHTAPGINAEAIKAISKAIIKQSAAKGGKGIIRRQAKIKPGTGGSKH